MTPLGKKDFDYVLMADYQRDMTECREMATSMIRAVREEKDRIEELFYAVIMKVGEVRLSQHDISKEYKVEKTTDVLTGDLVIRRVN